MFAKLEAYLAEIEKSLPQDCRKEKIIDQIKNRMWQSCLDQFGEVNEENMDKVLAGMGSPQAVSDAYREGLHLIAPSLARFIFPATWILFGCHLALTFILFIMKAPTQYVFFFWIPHFDHFWQLAAILPMTWLADFGLVAFYLHLLSKQRKRLRLIGLLPLTQKDKAKSIPHPPRLVHLIVMFAGFVVLYLVFKKYDTLFFWKFSFVSAQSLFSPAASRIYSYLVLGMFVLEIIIYVVRMVKNSPWILVSKNGCYLLVLWAVINFPMKDALAKEQGVLTDFFIVGLLVILAIIVIKDLLKYLFVALPGKK